MCKKHWPDKEGIATLDVLALAIGYSSVRNIDLIGEVEATGWIGLFHKICLLCEPSVDSDAEGLATSTWRSFIEIGQRRIGRMITTW